MGRTPHARVWLANAFLFKPVLGLADFSSASLKGFAAGLAFLIDLS
jgi:hypothetical protein